MKRKLKVDRVFAYQYAILVFFCLIILVPVLLTVQAGFKTTGQLVDDPVGFPNPFIVENYIKVFANSNFFRYFFNSFLIMALTVILDLIIAGCGGFALSRFKLKGMKLLFNYILLGLLFPLTLAMLPLYIQLRSLKLLNTHFGVILPQVAFQLPFHIIIFRGFMRQIPNELEDACTMDGFGKIGFLYHVVLPLSGPVIATVGVLCMVFSWNNYFLPLIVIDDKFKFTLPMGSMDYIGQYSAEWNLILAFFSICMVPAIVFYILAQRYIVAGLTSGAIKA
ncbi:MAG: carbohydrate ABC transporter permease [Spirochaetales bacterium]|nr:carbohydrate ABC transporter permease [Spirochaetales bacterium]